MNRTPITNPSELGDAIRRARKGLGMTQGDLALAANASVMAISRLERGAGATRIETVMRVAAVLGLDLILNPRTADARVPSTDTHG